MKLSRGSTSSIPGHSSPPGPLSSNPWKSYRNQARRSLYQVRTVSLVGESGREKRVFNMYNRDKENISDYFVAHLLEKRGLYIVRPSLRLFSGFLNVLTYKWPIA